MEKADNVCVRFTGKNYTAWSFQMEIYLKGKGLWSRVEDGEKGSSDGETSATAKVEWATKDAQIMS